MRFVKAYDAFEDVYYGVIRGGSSRYPVFLGNDMLFWSSFLDPTVEITRDEFLEGTGDLGEIVLEILERAQS